MFVFCEMNSWETHEVNFAPAEGLEKNETSIRVLDQDVKDGVEVVSKIRQRIETLDDPDLDDSDVLYIRNELTNKIKEDPGYKFLMMVSAFSRLRLGNMIREQRSRILRDREHVCEHACAAPESDNKKWLNIPEVTGVVQLSSQVYGHIKEAEMIVRNRCADISLKELVENPAYATQFARLVGIRIVLSGVLTGLGNRRDRSFHRLHMEQNMILKLFPVSSQKSRHDWTRPRDVLWR